jgi:cytochrome c biogenesis protein CcdA
MLYRYLADLVVAIHVAYVSFVVFGQLAIWLGLLVGWSWVRNPWFRWIHLVLMTIVGLEAVLGITCPLTDWESALRERAGQQVQGELFVGRLLHNLIFVDLPSSVITAIHITFALLVIGTFVLAPPRRSQRRPVSS